MEHLASEEDIKALVQAIRDGLYENGFISPELVIFFEPLQPFINVKPRQTNRGFFK